MTRGLVDDHAAAISRRASSKVQSIQHSARHLASRDLHQTHMQALEVTLGLADEDMVDVSSRSFGQLGGDSLAAIQFARHVSELCGVNLQVPYVLDHSHSLQAITDHVEQLIG